MHKTIQIINFSENQLKCCNSFGFHTTFWALVHKCILQGLTLKPRLVSKKLSQFIVNRPNQNSGESWSYILEMIQKCFFFLLLSLSPQFGLTCLGAVGGQGHYISSFCSEAYRQYFRPPIIQRTQKVLHSTRQLL